MRCSCRWYKCDNVSGEISKVTNIARYSCGNIAEALQDLPFHEPGMTLVNAAANVLNFGIMNLNASNGDDKSAHSAEDCEIINN